MGSLAYGTRYDKAICWYETNIKYAANEIVALDFAYGRLNELDADGRRVISLLYQPVTASVKGTWRGKAVKWQQTFGNSCEMTRATGVLFDF